MILTHRPGRESNLHKNPLPATIPTGVIFILFIGGSVLFRRPWSSGLGLGGHAAPVFPYWLWRLDYALWEKVVVEGKDSLAYPNLDVEAVRQYEFRTNRSIEHLHPQNQDNNDEWSWGEVNSFGNLAMISQSFNSQQSNLPVHVKFANLEVQIGNKNLQSLKLYFMYLKAKGSDAEWTVKAMNEHEKEMLDILKASIKPESIKDTENG